ncbi:hypothetical protein GCM10020254_61290 [Streptomyces goshikiensis]
MTAAARTPLPSSAGSPAITSCSRSRLARNSPHTLSARARFSIRSRRRAAWPGVSGSTRSTTSSQCAQLAGAVVSDCSAASSRTAAASGSQSVSARST